MVLSTASACAESIAPSRGLLPPRDRTRSDRRKPAPRPGTRPPAGKRARRPRKRPRVPAQLLAPRAGSPTPANPAEPHRQSGQKAQAATPLKTALSPGQAKYPAAPALAGMQGHRPPSDSPNAPFPGHRLRPGSPRAPLDLPYPDGSLIKTPARCQPFAQTLRAYIGPVLFDELQTRSAVSFPINHSPTGWNISKHRPQTVLLFVVDHDAKAAIVIVERIDAHSSPGRLGEMSGTVSKRYWSSTGSVGGFN